MVKPVGVQLSLTPVGAMEWTDLPIETRQAAREQMARLVYEAAMDALQANDGSGPQGDADE